MSDNVPALIVSKPEIEKIKHPSKKDVLDALRVLISNWCTKEGINVR